MVDQNDRVEEVKELISGKQGELVRLAGVEEEEETPLRSRGTATAAATPQEAGIRGPGSRRQPGSSAGEVPTSRPVRTGRSKGREVGEQ